MFFIRSSEKARNALAPTRSEKYPESCPKEGGICPTGVTPSYKSPEKVIEVPRPDTSSLPLVGLVIPIPTLP